MLQNLALKGLKAIEEAKILVDFDTGHNHGTKFRLRQIVANVYKITVIFNSIYDKQKTLYSIRTLDVINVTELGTNFEPRI